MAKLPALVTALAEVDGRERQAVEHVGRVIREAGYIPTGKRGGGAAEMGISEAANLIIALSGADMPKEAPLAIDRFRSLRKMYVLTPLGTVGELRAKEILPDGLGNLFEVQTFGQAIESLLVGVPSICASLHTYIMTAFERDEQFADLNLPFMLRGGSLGLDISFERYAATVEMFTMNGSQRITEFEAVYVKDNERMRTGFYGGVASDRKVRVTIGFLTLLTAWQAINPDAALPGFAPRLSATLAETAK